MRLVVGLFSWGKPLDDNTLPKHVYSSSLQLWRLSNTFCPSKADIVFISLFHVEWWFNKTRDYMQNSLFNVDAVLAPQIGSKNFKD